MTKSYIDQSARELSLRSLDIPSVHKFTVGFDNIFDSLMRAASTSNSTNYPPYNVVKHSDDEFSIELAVAGFGEEEIEIELENSVLTVSGEKSAEDQFREGVVFLHQGISSRSFKRSFTLAEHVEVVEASVNNGILSISLERQIPEEKKPKRIAIKFNK